MLNPYLGKKRRGASKAIKYTLRRSYNGTEHHRLILERLRLNYLSREIVERLQY